MVIQKSTRVPADLPEWERVVMDSNRLQRIPFEDDSIRAIFFSSSSGNRSSSLSTAPYLSDGGVTIKNTPSEKTIACLKELLKEHRAKHLVLKSRVPIFETADDKVVTDTSYSTFRLNLQGGADHVWENVIRAKTRNQTRTALKNDPETRTGTSKLLDDFYRIITTCLRDLGTPTYSRRFFESILKDFGDNAQLMVNYLEGKPASGALLLTVDKTIYHPYAATLTEYNRLSLNNALYWRIIEHACGRGLEFFDMGRSHMNQGTYRYKTRWEAEPVPLYYTYILAPGHAPPDFQSRFMQLATSAWKKLPVPVANLLGPPLIRHVM